MRASRGLKWANKMYKLKRSIGHMVQPCTFPDAGRDWRIKQWRIQHKKP